MFGHALRSVTCALALACGLAACGQAPATGFGAQQVQGPAQSLSKKGELGTLTFTAYETGGKAPGEVKVRLGYWPFYNTKDGLGPFTEHSMNDVAMAFTLTTDRFGQQVVQELEVWRTDRDLQEAKEVHHRLVHQGKAQAVPPVAAARTRRELEWIAKGIQAGKIFGKLYTMGELSAASKALLREHVSAALAALPKP